jgi:signal transduction histidine kinase
MTTSPDNRPPTARTTDSPRGGRRGLQTRVLFLVGFGMLASLAIMGGASWLYLNSLGRQLLAEREMLAGSVADHVEYVLQADLETLQGVSSAPAVNFEDADSEPERLAANDANLRARLFDRVLLAREGNWLSDQSPAVGRDYEPLMRLVRDAEATGRPGVSSLMTAASARRLYALVPLRNWHAQVVAVAVGEIDPAGPRFTALISSVRLGGNGSVDLLDTAGDVLASTSPARAAFRTDHAALVRRVLDRRQPSVETCRDCVQPGRAGERVTEVMAVAPLSVAPWAVAVRQAESEAFAPVFALGQDILLLGSVLLALALLFAWGVARSVRRPVAVLTRAAERIAGGNLEAPIPALGEDEVGRLGRSLEHMRIALKASIDHVERANAELEQRVRERTRELEGLYRELQVREQWRGELLAKVIGAQEEERKRLARELHDETSQTLSALAMRLETAIAAFPGDVSRQRLLEARELTVRTLDELHRLIYDLRPSVLDDLGLLSAIRWYAERHLEPLGVTVHWEFSGQERRLQPEVETALFRVVQEAITNVAKYAHAESVLIQCDLKDDAISIEIEDDGDGFDPAAVPTPGRLPEGAGAPTRGGDGKRGLGLMGMRERVVLLGGTIVIDAAPGKGVRIAVAVPLKREATYV